MNKRLHLLGFLLNFYDSSRIIVILLIVVVVNKVHHGHLFLRTTEAANAPPTPPRNAATMIDYYESNTVPGLPIAIIYHTNTSVEIRNNVDKAIKQLNSKMKNYRFSIQIATIDTSDTNEVIKTMCQQMSRGVLAIFGNAVWSSLNTINSFTNYYNVPYISWSHSIRPKSILSSSSAYYVTNGSAAAGSRYVNYNYLFKRDLSDINYNYKETNIAAFDRARYIRNSYENEMEYESMDELIVEENLTENVEIEDDGDGYKNYNQLHLRPDMSMALIELIKYNGWTNLYYIYNHEEAISNLESLFEYQLHNTDFAKKILIRKVKNVKNCRDMLRAIEASPEMNNQISEHDQNKIIIILDLDTKKSYMSMLNQIKDLGMTKTQYHYVLNTLGIYELDLNDFRHGGVTITGFSIVDYYSFDTVKLLSDLVHNGEALNKMANIPHEAALLIDGLIYLSKRVSATIGSDFNRLFGIDNVSLKQNAIYVGKTKGVNCAFDIVKSKFKWPLGKHVYGNLVSQSDNLPKYDGLTGPFNFHENGSRKNYTIGVYRVGLNQQLSKVGVFTSTSGLKIDEEKMAKDRGMKSSGSNDKKLVVISIKDDPFMMIRTPEAGKNYTGNDKYMGYCVDLAKKLSEMLNFTYELRLVRDNKFGARDASGNWDGIVGELIRHEADIAVAPLTISSQRERVIEFSMPFMNIGISIMIKKPKKEKPGVFSFMAPLDTQIWLCVILAYVGVSVILFLVSRFSPYEWHYDETKNATGLNNDFTILNTLWFNLAAVMQQGVDLAPKSVSGRLVASAWWFFTLILISSYTANLAAFLTVERMVAPIESAEDLVKQNEIQYGVLEGGATKEFFRNSKVPTYQRMWTFMNSWGPSVFVKDNMEGAQKVRESKGKYAYLLESSLNEYLNERLPCDTIKVGNDLDSKGYGVATPIRSEWRDPINLAILQLREEGFLDELKTKWWYDRSECGNSAGSSKDSSQSALNLINVAGIFYILIIGLIMSVLVATLELMYKAKLQSKANKINFSEAVKSKMRLSISGYEESLRDFRQSNGIPEEPNQLTPFPTLNH